MRIIGFSLAGLLAGAVPVGAQVVRADPGVVIGDRIAVRVNVTLSDEETPYYPVRGFTLAFARPTADTVVGRTDEAGVLTVLLLPGDYVVASPRPVAWKGVWYGWSMPLVVRRDMRAIDLNRRNARVSGTAPSTATDNSRSAQSGRAASATGTAASGTSSEGSIRWLSIEVGGEGGITQLGMGTGSDAGYGGSGSFVGGIGPFALALGYRYTRLRYGGELESGNMSGATAELRYHLRPGAAPVRPYIGAIAETGTWEGDDVGAEKFDVTMFGGTAGAQFGLATSVRLHVAMTVAGTNIRSSPNTSGLFTTAHVGLTFDIFSPAR